MVSLKHEQVVVRTVGTMAVVTNAYTSQTTPIGAPNAEPDTYTGRHTEVLDKRHGRRMVIAEPDTEQMHDDKLMERKVANAGREYYAVVQRLRSGRSEADLATSGDLAASVRVFATEYTGTAEDGAIRGKAQVIEHLKNQSDPAHLIRTGKSKNTRHRQRRSNENRHHPLRRHQGGNAV